MTTFKRPDKEEISGSEYIDGKAGVAEPARTPPWTPWFDAVTSTWYVWSDEGIKHAALCPVCKRVKCSIHADAAVFPAAWEEAIDKIDEVITNCEQSNEGDLSVTLGKVARIIAAVRGV